MIRFLADENLNRHIVEALVRRDAEIDIVRVQDVNLKGADDLTILEWAAQEKRILLKHDASTMTDFAYDRVKAGLAMPGVFEIKSNAPVKAAVEEILLIAGCSLEDEWEGQVRYLPLR